MRHKPVAEKKNRKVKEVISLQKRYWELGKAQSGQPLVPLEKPIRAGWQRYFVLRPDLVNSKNAKTLLTILGMINNTVYSRNKEFTYRRWKDKKDIPITQHLLTLPDKKGQELEPKYQRWFVRTKFIYPYSKQVYYNWVFTHPQFFVFRIRPNYLTHKQLVDSDLESEVAYVGKKLYNDRRYRILDKFSARRWYDWDDKPSIRDQRLSEGVQDQLDED